MSPIKVHNTTTITTLWSPKKRAAEKGHLKCQIYPESAHTVHQRKRHSGGLGHWAQRRCAMLVEFDTNRAGWSLNIDPLRAQLSCWPNIRTLTGKLWNSGDKKRFNNKECTNITFRSADVIVCNVSLHQANVDVSFLFGGGGKAFIVLVIFLAISRNLRIIAFTFFFTLSILMFYLLLPSFRFMAFGVQKSN